MRERRRRRRRVLPEQPPPKPNLTASQHPNQRPKPKHGQRQKPAPGRLGPAASERDRSFKLSTGNRWRSSRHRFLFDDPIIALLFQIERELLVAGADDASVIEDVDKIGD